MPFGLWNAPAHFHRMVERALRGCRDFSLPCIHEVLIFSKEPEEHMEYVTKVLTALREAKLAAKLTNVSGGRNTSHT